MPNAKFQVVIKDIREDQLGPILGALPNGITPEISRTQGRAIQPKPAASEPRTKPHGSIQAMVAAVPQRFQAKDFVKAIEKNGFNGNSISHFLRQAMKAGLIKKLSGNGGNKTTYEKV